MRDFDCSRGQLSVQDSRGYEKIEPSGSIVTLLYDLGSRHAAVRVSYAFSILSRELQDDNDSLSIKQFLFAGPGRDCFTRAGSFGVSDPVWKPPRSNLSTCLLRGCMVRTEAPLTRFSRFRASTPKSVDPGF